MKPLCHPGEWPVFRIRMQCDYFCNKYVFRKILEKLEQHGNSSIPLSQYHPEYTANIEDRDCIDSNIERQNIKNPVLWITHLAKDPSSEMVREFKNTKYWTSGTQKTLLLRDEKLHALILRRRSGFTFVFEIQYTVVMKPKNGVYWVYKKSKNTLFWNGTRIQKHEILNFRYAENVVIERWEITCTHFTS